jgi:hypothetical protein
VASRPVLVRPKGFGRSIITANVPEIGSKFMPLNVNGSSNPMAKPIPVTGPLKSYGGQVL